MKAWNSLQKIQRKLLREVRDGNELLSLVMEKLGVDDKRLSRWLRNDNFSKGLDEAQQMARDRASRQLHSAATFARRRIAAGLTSENKIEPSERLLCKDVMIRSDRDTLRIEAEQKKLSAQAENSPIHPDFTGKVDELLEVLEGQ